MESSCMPETYYIVQIQEEKMFRKAAEEIA
jgi:hypothetical protein